MGPTNRIFGADVFERISDGGESFALSSSEEGIVATNEDELIGGQEMMITHSYCQLHGVISFKRMALGKVRCRFQISRCQWNDCITMDKLSSEASVFSISLTLRYSVHS